MLKFNVREGDRKNNVSGQKQLGPHNTVIHNTQPHQVIRNILPFILYGQIVSNKAQLSYKRCHNVTDGDGHYTVIHM